MNPDVIATIRSTTLAAIAANPEHKADFIELSQMAVEEIQSGESADNEIQLLKDGIAELIA